AFKRTQQAAFEAERRRWAEAASEETEREPVVALEASAVADGAAIVESHVHGSVWQVRVQCGARVARGDVLVVIESMKMEIHIEAPDDGTVLELLAAPGRPVIPGQPLVALRSG